MKHEYIDSELKLSLYLNKLNEANVEAIALDIEGESNLHHYGEKLCLVQIYDGQNAVIIDPFKTPLRQIQQIIENRMLMKIMFDVSGDRAFLYKNYGIDILSAFDLQAAVGVLNYEKRDLSSVLKQTLGVDTGKSKRKFQTYNWTTRPLHHDALEYALEDVIYLFALKDRLVAEITAKGLLDRFTHKNLQAQNKPHQYDKRPKLLRSGHFLKLPSNERRIYEKLFYIREKYAKELDFPANAVVPNDLLFELTAGRTKPEQIHSERKIPENIRNRMIEEMNQHILG
jgi:ribonuclease D